MSINRFKLDFTLEKYRELCEAISESDYSVLTLEKYFSLSIKDKPYIIIRHDIDSEPEYALKMAKIENKFGITSSYYFRYIDNVFIPSIIKEIANLGHEIGYHYEVIDKTKGDPNLAIEIFKKELEAFRSICNVKTIAQHGSPLIGDLRAGSLRGLIKIFGKLINAKDVFTPWINLDLWKEFDFREFNLLGEAYLSVNFSEVYYLSDTGRSWDSSRYKLKDLATFENNELNVESTNDIIDLIKNSKKNVYLLVHPNQWKETFVEWLTWLVFQYIRNTGKSGLKVYWKLKEKLSMKYD